MSKEKSAEKAVEVLSEEEFNELLMDVAYTGAYAFEGEAYRTKLRKAYHAALADSRLLDWFDKQRFDILRGPDGEPELIGHGWAVRGEYYTLREALEGEIEYEAKAMQQWEAECARVQQAEEARAHAEGSADA